jgi:hypothetical protein
MGGWKEGDVLEISRSRLAPLAYGSIRIFVRSVVFKSSAVNLCVATDLTSSTAFEEKEKRETG